MEVIVVCLLLIFHIPLMNGEIQHLDVLSESRNVIMFEDFGFSKGGYISISLSSVFMSSTSTNPVNSSLMGFFYAPSPAFDALEDALFNNSCILGKPFISPIVTFNELSNFSITSINKTIPITSPDLYYVFFLNCAPQTSISMQVNLETYNLNPKGKKDFIDEHFIVSPAIGFSLSALYFIFLLLWIYACYKNRPFVHRIHIFMMALLLVKSLELFSRDETQCFVRFTGTPHGWDIIWLALTFIRTLLFDIVFVLMGSGWSLLTPCLPDIQKLVLALSVLMQIVVDICFIVMQGMGPLIENYSYWVVTFYAVDFSCSMWIVFPVSHTIDNLRESSKTEGKEAITSFQLTLFCSIYICLQAYVYMEKLGIFILRIFLSYKFWWVSVILEQAIEGGVYMLAFYTFRPNEKNDYFVLEERQGEEELVTVSSMPTSVVV
ncbi:PREDICTED: protein GPR107-like [Ipomoea nil]|uniref:protein GPR107-like n=1 Tax=Ipomoea nil TaxID=35883 RepID=UPI00090191A4|nr:PREDICTED: protein GPR107-like [Ipomoea nil]